MAITLSGNNPQQNNPNTNSGGISLSTQPTTQPTMSAQPVSGGRISLSKGQKVSLTKQAPGLNNILVGLGWDTNRYDGGQDFDLDASVFMLGENGKVPSDAEFIFFNQKTHSSGCIEHMGDNRTGEGAGDDEVININLSKVPSNINKIVFVVTIYDAQNRRQNFGQVENSYIRLVNADTNIETLRFDLGEDFSIENSVNVAEIYRHNGEWKFNAVGAGYANGLEGFAINYGVNL